MTPRGLARAGLLLGVLAPAAPAAGAGQGLDRGLDRDAALAASRAAVGTAVGNHAFVDSAGAALRLDDLRGRPLVLSLVYSSCHHSCPVLTSHLARMVEVAREALGGDAFAVLSVGFDTAHDTPTRMASFARARGVDAAGWHFLSTDPGTVQALAREVGFRYVATPAGFDHLAQVTILDAEGRVYRQIYGDSFPAPYLVEPLKQLVLGRRAEAPGLAGWLDGVKLLCTIYDPSTGRYRFDYSIFVAAGVGALCLGGIAAFVVRAWRDRGPPARSA